MENLKLRYDGNENETYTLFINDVPTAELLVGEDGAITITNVIKYFIEHSAGVIVDIKNDDDKLGVIVDMWDEEQSDVIETITIWFEDYYDY